MKYDRKLRELVSKDPLSYETYSIIREMAKVALQSKSVKPLAVEDISHKYANDLIWRISNGFYVYSWYNYIRFNIVDYINPYYDETRSVEFVTNDPVELREYQDVIYNLSIKNDRVENSLKTYLYHLSTTIKDLVNRYSKYTDHIVNRGLVLTILSSIADEEFKLVELSDEYYNYARFLYNYVSSKIIDDIRVVFSEYYERPTESREESNDNG